MSQRLGAEGRGLGGVCLAGQHMVGDVDDDDDDDDRCPASMLNGVNHVQTRSKDLTIMRGPMYISRSVTEQGL